MESRNKVPLVAPIIAAVIFAMMTGAQAQDVSASNASIPASNPVDVGVSIDPPFIMRDGDGFSGLSFEIFEDVSRRGNLAPNYIVYDTPQDVLTATAAGQVDIGIGNLTITRARLATVDFTFPWHDGGLRILVNSTNAVDLGNLWGELRDAGHLRTFFWLAFFLIGATLLLTLFDRRFDKDYPRGWFDGLANSFYDVISMTTTGRTSRKMMFGAMGKLFAALWLVYGVAVLAYVTSSVTSVMTANAVGNDINDIDDLRGHAVGVLSGGASELYGRNTGMTVRPYSTLEAAQASLDASAVDAVIADALTLEYFVHLQSAAGFEVVGPVFDPVKYGFATSIGSPLTRSLSLDLLSAQEDGTTARLRNQYLGVSH